MSDGLIGLSRIDEETDFFCFKWDSDLKVAVELDELDMLLDKLLLLELLVVFSFGLLMDESIESAVLSSSCIFFSIRVDLDDNFDVVFWFCCDV